MWDNIPLRLIMLSVEPDGYEDAIRAAGFDGLVVQELAELLRKDDLKRRRDRMYL